MKKVLKAAVAFLAFGVFAVNTGPQSISVGAADAVKKDTSRVSLSSYDSGLMIEPTMIFEPESYSGLSDAFSERKRPASVILTPDASMNVSLGNETKTLEQVYDDYIKDKFIPIVRIADSTVDSFIEWQNETYAIDDMMVLSSDISVIGKIYRDKRCSLLNTVYDLTDAEISSDRYASAEYIGEANASGCNILMLDASDENFGTAAEYISALTKCCWGYVEDKTEAVSAIADGAYGIVAKDTAILEESLENFSESGFARAQYLAAHRGITTYANENSLTAISASVNEGATHVEIDLQITADREIVLCHDGETNATSIAGTYFEKATLAHLSKLTLGDYSEKYGESYPTLQEALALAENNDLIFILELKFSGGSTNVVDNLKPIDRLKEIMEAHPEMKGRWYAITFYAPFAERMKEIMPEIPVGYLGGATSGKEQDSGESGWGGGHVDMTNISGKIAFLRKYNLVLDESYYAATDNTAAAYLARGYTQNTWTFENVSHFNVKGNIVTSNAAEKCSMLVKELGTGDLRITRDDISKGQIEVPCRTYNGWIVNLNCNIILTEETSKEAYILLYYRQNWSYVTSKDREEQTIEGCYGIYSKLLKVSF